MRAWRRSRLAVEALAARLGRAGVTDVARRNSLYLAGNVLGEGATARARGAARIGLPGRFLDRKALREQIRDRAGCGAHGLRQSRDRSAQGHARAVAGGRRQRRADICAGRNDRRCAAKGRRDGRPRPTGGASVAGISFLRPAMSCPHGVTCRHHKITSTWAIATVRAGRQRCGRASAASGKPPIPISISARRRKAASSAAAKTRRSRTTKSATRCSAARQQCCGASCTGCSRSSTQRRLSRGPAPSGKPPPACRSSAQVPGMPRCLIALGYGGNGTTYAAIAADVITGAIAGRPDVDADLYRFPAMTRRMISSRRAEPLPAGSIVMQPPPIRDAMKRSPAASAPHSSRPQPSTSTPSALEQALTHGPRHARRHQPDLPRRGQGRRQGHLNLPAGKRGKLSQACRKLLRSYGHAPTIRQAPVIERSTASLCACDAPPSRARLGMGAAPATVRAETRPINAELDLPDAEIGGTHL